MISRVGGYANLNRGPRCEESAIYYGLLVQQFQWYTVIADTRQEEIHLNTNSYSKYMREFYL